MRNTCFHELIEQNEMYLFLTEKLEIPKSQFSTPIGNLCQMKSWDFHWIKSLLKSYDDNLEFPINELQKVSPKELLKYLQITHQYYLNKKLPELEQSIFQVFGKFNETYPLLSVLCLFFNDYKKRLEKHILFEEAELFPYIKKLNELTTQNSENEILAVLSTFSVTTFINSHTKIEDELQEVRQLILKYSNGKSTPLPFRIFLSQLQHFEIELTRHALLEDEVLIPLVIQKESELLTHAAKITLNKNKFC